MTTANEDPIVTRRRARLRAWIDTRFGGSAALFIASTNNGDKQLNQGELSALLRTKAFGERRARSLERMAQMPFRYLDGPDAESQPAYTNNVQEKQAVAIAQPAAAPVGWPFSKVSLARIVAIKKALGPRMGTTAMADIDDTLDLVVAKWERRHNSHSNHTKSAA